MSDWRPSVPMVSGFDDYGNLDGPYLRHIALQEAATVDEFTAETPPDRVTTGIDPNYQASTTTFAGLNATPILDNRPVAERVDELEKRLEHRIHWVEHDITEGCKRLESRIEKLEKLIENFQHAVCENLEKNHERFEKLENNFLQFATADGHGDMGESD